MRKPFKSDETKLPNSDAKSPAAERPKAETKMAQGDKVSTTSTVTMPAMAATTAVAEKNSDIKAAWNSLLNAKSIPANLTSTSFDQLERHQKGTANAVEKMVEAVSLMIMTKNKDSAYFSQLMNDVLVQAANARVGLKDIEDFIIIASDVHEIPNAEMLSVFHAELEAAQVDFEKKYPNLPRILEASEPLEPPPVRIGDSGLPTHIVARAYTEHDLGNQLAQSINDANMTSQQLNSSEIKKLSETVKAFKKTPFKNAITPELSSSINTIEKLLNKASRYEKTIPVNIVKKIRNHLSSMGQNENFIKELSAPAKSEDNSIEAAIGGVEMPQLSEKIASATQTAPLANPPHPRPQEVEAAEAIRVTTETATPSKQNEAASRENEKKETSNEEHSGEPVLSEDEKDYIKESVKVGYLNAELENGVNDLLRDFYQPEAGSNTDFFMQFEKHFLSLGDQIDQANFGFTHQDVKETFDRLKGFTAKVQEINSTPMDPMAKTQRIADLINADPSFIRDAANVMGYTNDLMIHFKDQSEAFSDPQKGMGKPLNHFTSKIFQFPTKFALHLKNYEKIRQHPSVTENAARLAETFGSITQNFNRAMDVSFTRMSENYRRLDDLHVKDTEVKTKTVSSKKINEDFKLARDQIFLLIGGKVSAEDKGRVVEKIEDVLWLYSAKLPGGTSLENKEIILKNIPSLLEFIQIADPKHIDEKLINALRSAIIEMRDPKAKNPVDFKENDEQRTSFIAATNKAMQAIDEVSIRANKEPYANIAAEFEGIDFTAGLPNTEQKSEENSKAEANEALTDTPKAEIEFADLSAQFKELSELKEPVQAEPAKPSIPDLLTEPEISMIDVERYVEENKALDADVIATTESTSIAEANPVESTVTSTAESDTSALQEATIVVPVKPGPPVAEETASTAAAMSMESVQPVVSPVAGKAVSEAQKASSSAIRPEVAEFKKNLGTEGSMMYHLRFGYRTARANMKPAEYIEHLKACEPELYNLSKARAEQQNQNRQTETPSTNRAEYRETMRKFRSEGKFGPIIALVGTGLGAVSNDLRTLATRVTNPRLYRQQRDETQLREKIMAVSRELQHRVSPPETIPGTRNLIDEMTTPLYESIQAA